MSPTAAEVLLEGGVHVVCTAADRRFEVARLPVRIVAGKAAADLAGRLAAREEVGVDLRRERVAAGQAPEARAAQVGLDVVLLDVA